METSERERERERGFGFLGTEHRNQCVYIEVVDKDGKSREINKKHTVQCDYVRAVRRDEGFLECFQMTLKWLEWVKPLITAIYPKERLLCSNPKLSELILCLLILLFHHLISDSVITLINETE